MELILILLIFILKIKKKKVIDDWAQSLSIIVSNYKNTWTKEKFLDYLAATLQGDTLQWLKQWEKSEEGKQQKTALLTNFLNLEDILRQFANIIKEQFCGYIGEPTLQDDANFMLSKLELCNICQFEEYVKVFRKYYFLVNPQKMNIG
jgi:hypothetical protein